MTSYHAQQSALLSAASKRNEASVASLATIIVETLREQGIPATYATIATGFGSHRARITAATDGDDAVAFCDSTGRCSPWNSPRLAQLAGDAIRDHRVRVEHSDYMEHFRQQRARLDA